MGLFCKLPRCAPVEAGVERIRVTAIGATPFYFTINASFRGLKRAKDYCIGRSKKKLHLWLALIVKQWIGLRAIINTEHEGNAKRNVYLLSWKCFSTDLQFQN